MNNIKVILSKEMNKLLKNAYTRFWVPVMGRLVSVFIPLLEGKSPEKSPTYDMDGKNINKE